MHIRAPLAIPALAAAALAISAGSASAATLFTTAAHTTRVTFGATATATSEGFITFTHPAATTICTHLTLYLRLTENTTARTALEVYTSTTGVCHSPQYNGTYTTPWKLTILGHGVMVGPSQAYAATVHNVAYDFIGVPGPFTGNLEGVTITQPTTTTSPICINADNAGTVTNATLGPSTVDGKFCLTTAPSNTWSLT